jgi:hypothetical protein
MASAIRNLLPKDTAESRPDLVIHHSGRPMTEYNNGGFEIDSCPTALAFKNQAKYYMSISDRSFHYHISFIFVLLNILQRQQAHLQTYFTVGKSNFDSVARKLTAVTPALLEALATKLEQEQKLVNPSPEERNALQLLQQVNTLSARIPGSQALKIFIHNEIRSYFRYFGLPHVFFTFNPSPALLFFR